MPSPKKGDLLRQWWKKCGQAFYFNNTCGGTLVVSRPKARQANDDPPVSRLFQEAADAAGIKNKCNAARATPQQPARPTDEGTT